MALQEQQLLSQRWTHVIRLRPAPVLLLYRALVLSLALFAVFGWHAALLSLIVVILLNKSPSTQLAAATSSAANVSASARLCFGPHDWIWQSGTQTIYYQVHQAWRGPFWYHVQLLDMQGHQRSLTLWQFSMSKTAWRRLNVLLQAKRWQQLAVR